MSKEIGFDIAQVLKNAEGQNYDLHHQHVNPCFSKVLRTIGFDRCYIKAQGAYLWDIQGHRYLDMLSGYGVFNFGRNHPVIRQALNDFMALDYPSLVQMEAPLLSGLLAEELKKRTANGLERVYFTSSGAEGVEASLKFARCATKRPVILYAHKAFHGLTTGALSVNGDEIFRDGFDPHLPGCQKIPFNDLEALEDALKTENVAAFIVEPIQGKGVNIPDPGYLKAACALCHRYGSLFICDEVQTGMGRTGRFYAHDHEDGLDPDMIILSKALSGGYVPVGAVLLRKEIFQKVFSSMDRAVVHSSTFGQGSLAMVAGLASLHLLEQDTLCQQATLMGDALGTRLLELKDRSEFIKDVRWRGLMMAIEFGPPKSLSLKTAWHLAHKMDKSLFPQAATIPLLDDHHLLTQVAGHHIDVIKLLPPLILTAEDVAWFVQGFSDVMDKMHRFPGPVWEVLSKIGKLAVTQRPRAGDI